MKLFFKMMGVATILVLAVAAVSYLQYRFDKSDLKHAIQAVQSSRPQGKESPMLVELLVQKYQVPSQQIAWIPQIESKFKGRVRVQAVVPKTSDQLVWRVDLLRYNVLPVSQGAKGLANPKVIEVKP